VNEVIITHQPVLKMPKYKSAIPALFILSLFSLQSLAQAPRKIKTIIVDAGHGGKDGGAHGAYEGGLNSWEKDITLAISNKLVADLEQQLPDVKVIPTRTSDIYQSPPEKANIANANKGDLFICIHADAVALKTGRRQTGTRIEIKHTVYYIGKGKKKKKMIKSRNVEVPIYEYYKIGTPRKGTSIWIFAAHKTSEKLKAIMQNDTDEIELGSGEDSTYNNDIDFNSTENRLRAQVYAKHYQERSVKLASLVDDEISKTDRPALGINQRQKGIWVLQATNMPAILVETGFIDNYDDERYLNSDAGQQEIADCIARAIVSYKEQVENANSIHTQDNTDSTNKATSVQH
jgi:N-acetylmuramoyl-L-alanine amidase